MKKLLLTAIIAAITFTAVGQSGYKSHSLLSSEAKRVYLDTGITNGYPGIQFTNRYNVLVMTTNDTSTNSLQWYGDLLTPAPLWRTANWPSDRVMTNSGYSFTCKLQGGADFTNIITFVFAAIQDDGGHVNTNVVVAVNHFPGHGSGTAAKLFATNLPVVWPGVRAVTLTRITKTASMGVNSNGYVYDAKVNGWEY